MKLHRIFGMCLRFMYAFKYSLDRLAEVFYWPIIELVIWGLASSYFQSVGSPSYPIVTMIISGIIFWLIFSRGQLEINMNILIDWWNKNLINIFASPLKFSEWVTSFLILSIVKAILSFSFAMFVGFVLYKIKLFTYGIYIVPFFTLLLMSGWWMGFLIASLTMLFGKKVEAFAWTFGAVIVPFSAIYYPVSVLPKWAQDISALLPTSYVFEGAREALFKGHLDANKLLISFLLNIVYILITLWFFRRSFYKLLKRGLINAL